MLLQFSYRFVNFSIFWDNYTIYQLVIRILFHPPPAFVKCTLSSGLGPLVPWPCRRMISSAMSFFSHNLCTPIRSCVINCDQYVYLKQMDHTTCICINDIHYIQLLIYLLFIYSPVYVVAHHGCGYQDAHTCKHMLQLDLQTFFCAFGMHKEDFNPQAFQLGMVQEGNRI